ncbi:MAG: hypothetical protein JWR16_2218 [Nevskia sp.]|nr:hypothetical protein [Nevskia sp.]
MIRTRIQIAAGSAAASAILLAAALHVTAAVAAVSADEAAHLGKDLTPVGATRAGNADGSIPEWTGASNFSDEQKHLTRAKLSELREKVLKLTPDEVKQAYAGGFAGSNTLDGVPAKPPYDFPPALAKIYQAEKAQLDKSDRPKLVITKANMAQYADKLSEGHKALLKQYADYRLIVYPTVRTAFFPDAINAATLKNATSAQLQGTDGVVGAATGFPFPIPKSGAEVIWNHKLKFRGSAVQRFNDQAIVKPDGSVNLTKIVEDVKFKYANLKEPPAADNKIFAFYLSRVIAPPRVAGQITLVQEPFIGNRVAYIFDPGLGRVNRAPDVGYDNPNVGTDGEQFTDQVDTFNGALDRYNWKLVGKKEMYIPYNSYTINAPAPLVSYKQLLLPGHINQNLARYELHRVWVVDATLKDGVRHSFKRRTFYVDEDSWSIVAVDCYDNHNILWKFQEGHLLTAPFIPTTTAIPEIIYDLQSRRYFTTAMINENTEIINFEASYADSHFDPASLKRMAQNH